MSFAELLGRRGELASGHATPNDTLVTRPLFWHFPAYLARDASVSGPWRTTPASAVRSGDYKLIYFFEENRMELYNLRTDIGEAVDLTDREPAKAAELEAILRAWWEDTDAFLPKALNLDFDSQLRATADEG